MIKSLFALFALLTPLSALEVVEDLSDLTFKTPSMAEVQNRKIRLDNGLEALLISDPHIGESGMALAVEAGSWQDPEEAAGMAHFTEHMLFLGNATYPEENGFRAFLEAHNGKANAFTADQFTCYMFTIDSDALGLAMDPFAHFFIDPLFTTSAMARERGAVDQEFERAKENDAWREEMVKKAVANPDHPHSAFGFGSHETLDNLSSEGMRTWFENHYSSQIMHLLVYSSLSLDELEGMVETTFSQIPNRGVGPFPTKGAKTAPTTAGKILAIAPHKSLRNMTLIWELPYNDGEERAGGAARFAAYLLGHEGPGRLGADLTRAGLIEGIAAQVDAYRKPHSATHSLLLSVDLTEQGLQERDRVIGRIFSAINYFKETPQGPALFDEMQGVHRLNYEYATRSDLFALLRDHATHLAEEPLATYPQEIITAKTFDPEKTRALFQTLTPRNTHITLLADPKESGIKPSQKEPHMGARYATASLSKEQLEGWDAAPATPSFPTPNPYVPKELTLAQTPGLEKPLSLVDTDFAHLYYADDTSLSVPEIAWILTIKSPAVIIGDPKSAALLDLLLTSIGHALNEESYSAKLGGLSYSLKPAEEGLLLTLSGFREKAPLLFTQLLKTLKTNTPSEADFATLKGALEVGYSNFAKETPTNQSMEFFRSLLIHDFITAAEKGEALKDLTLQDLVAFRDAFTKETYVEGVLFGNLTPQEAEATAQEIRHFQEAPYPGGKERKAVIATLPDQGPFLVTKKSKARGCAAILTLQETPYSLKNRSLQQLLAAALEEPFFSALRTQQQTGYVVWSWEQDMEHHLFQSFLVQSNTHDCRDLIARYESFIESFLRTLQTGEFTQEQFETLKGSLIAKLQRPPKNPKEAAAHLFAHAFLFDDFDWVEKRVEATKALTFEEFQKTAQEWLGKANKRRLGVLLEGKLPPETLKYKTLNSPQKWKALSVYEGKPSGAS